MTPDSNGILMVEDTDSISPFQVLINTLQAATSQAIFNSVVAGYVEAGANQSIPAATVTNLTFPSENKRLDGGITYSGGVFTVPTTGWYNLNGGVRFASVSSGIAQLRIYAGGNQVAYTQGAMSSGIGLNAGRSVYLAGGSTVYAATYQSSGGAIDAGANFGQPFLSVTKVK